MAERELPSGWSSANIYSDSTKVDRALKLVYSKNRSEETHWDYYLIRNKTNGRLVYAHKMPYLYIWCHWPSNLSDLDFYAYWTGLGGWNNTRVAYDSSSNWQAPPLNDYQSAGYGNRTRVNTKITTNSNPSKEYYLAWSDDKTGPGAEEWFGIKKPGYDDTFFVHMRFYQPIPEGVSMDQAVCQVRARWMEGDSEESVLDNVQCGGAYRDAGYEKPDGYGVRACSLDPYFYVKFEHDNEHDYDVAVITTQDGRSMRVPCPGI